MADLSQREPGSASSRAEPEPDGASVMALACAAAEGDEQATKRLLDVLAPRIARVVRATLGVSHPELDDISQLALIAFTMALASFRGECHPVHYASRIAVRTALRARRQAALTRSRRDELSGFEGDATPSVHDDAVSRRRKHLVRALLGEIPAEQAEALALRVVLGWSLDEIASTSGAPLNTVRSRLRLAKEALRRRIEADPVLCEEFAEHR